MSHCPWLFPMRKKELLPLGPGTVKHAAPDHSVFFSRQVHRSLDAVIAHIAAAGRADLKIAAHVIDHQVAGADAVHLDVAADVLESQIPRADGAYRYAAANVTEMQVSGSGMARTDVADYISDGHVAGTGAPQLHATGAIRIDIRRAELQSQSAGDPVGFQVSRSGMEVERLQRLGVHISRPAVYRDGELGRYAHGEFHVRVP